MDDLDQLSAAALARPAQLPAIEFHKRWISWGEMRQVGERVGDLIVASGAGPGTRVAFVARNRPSALAAMVGMIARRCTIRMVYPFQSATAIARDLEGIEPSVLVAAAEDYSEAILAVLRAKGIAAIALREMEASALPGLERTRRAGDAALPPQVEILTSGTTGPAQRQPQHDDEVQRSERGQQPVGHGRHCRSRDTPVSGSASTNRAHRQRREVLTEKCARNPGDRAPRYDFF